MATPSAAAASSARPSAARTSASSPAPEAWAVSPVVPMRRNPKVQYTNENTSAPSAIAPSSATEPVHPITAVSTRPSSGTAQLATMIGHARRAIRRWDGARSTLPGGSGIAAMAADYARPAIAPIPAYPRAARLDAVERLRITNPATGESVGEVAVTPPSEVRARVARAREAQRAWAARPMRDRRRALWRFHDLCFDRQDEILDTIQRETGKTRRDAYGELVSVPTTARYYAAHGPRHLADEVRAGAAPLLTSARLVYRPHGVIGFVTPWNYPFLLAVGDALPALLAGNAAVIKPSEITPLSAELAVALLHEAGFPEDLVGCVQGRGPALGPALLGGRRLRRLHRQPRHRPANRGRRRGAPDPVLAGARRQEPDGRPARRAGRDGRRRLDDSGLLQLRSDLHRRRAGLRGAPDLRSIRRPRRREGAPTRRRLVVVLGPRRRQSGERRACRQGARPRARRRRPRSDPPRRRRPGRPARDLRRADRVDRRPGRRARPLGRDLRSGRRAPSGRLRGRGGGPAPTTRRTA